MTHVPTAAAPTPEAVRAARWWFGLCLLGNLLLELVGWARGNDAVRSDWPLLVGSGPNVAAVLAIAGALVGVVLTRPPATVARWPIATQIHATIAFTVGGLLLWEGMQPWSAHLVFDLLDVLATIVTGLALALLWPRVRRLSPRARESARE